MSWGVRPDRRFRLAVGSFIEEYRCDTLHWCASFLAVSCYTFVRSVYVCVFGEPRCPCCSRVNSECPSKHWRALMRAHTQKQLLT